LQLEQATFRSAALIGTTWAGEDIVGKSVEFRAAILTKVGLRPCKGFAQDQDGRPTLGQHARP
jgi:hypothetical protein